MSSNREQYEIRMTWIIILLLIPLILPDYFQSIKIVNDFTVLITGIIFFYLFGITFMKKEFNIFVIASFIFFIWRSFSSYYFSGGVLDLINSLRIVTLILLINITVKRYPKSTLQALSILFGTYITLNFISYFMFPEGLYKTDSFQKGWILGIENQFAFLIVPGISLIILYSWYKYNKISLISWILLIMSVLTVIKAWSATAIVSLFFIIISFSLNLKKKIKPVYSFFRLSIIYAVVWLVLVRFNSLESFQAIIVDLLNKDLTLSGRTRIWAVVFDAIPQSLWYGYGINTKVLAGVHTYFVAHNMILQTLLDNGLIGLILLILCIIIAGFNLQKFRYSRYSVMLLIGMFAILIGGLTESYRLNYLFLFLILSFNISFLDKETRRQ